MYQVIFHLDNEKKAQKLFNNVMNLLKDMKESNEEIEVEVLANSRAIQVFKRSNTKERKRIEGLLGNGVKITLCQNSLDGQELTKEDMLEETILVRSGVGELSRKQSEGWSYIKV